MKKLVIFPMAIAVLINCSSPSENMGDTAGNTLFPLTVGNSWTYQETFLSADTSYVREYTARIASIKNIGGYNWWELTFSPGSSLPSRYLMAENDSIYELQYNFQTPVRSLQYFLPTHHQQKFVSLLGGDVSIVKTAYILDTTITTPAGVFSACYLFSYASPDWTRKEILARGVGIIETEFISHPGLGPVAFRRIARLQSYHIQ